MRDSCCSYPRQADGSLQAERRKVEALAKNVKKVAKQIEIANATPSKFPTGWTVADLTLMARIPHLLREFATAWMDAHAILWIRFYPISQQNQCIVSLISIIEQITRRPHYRLVADLLNGIHAAQHGLDSFERWDKDDLKELYLNAKKRMTKVLRPRNQPK